MNVDVLQGMASIDTVDVSQGMASIDTVDNDEVFKESRPNDGESNETCKLILHKHKLFQRKRDSTMENFLDEDFPLNSDCEKTDPNLADHKVLNSSDYLLLGATPSDSITSDSDRSPSGLCTPCSILPEECDILSPTVNDYPFNFMDDDSLNSVQFDNISVGCILFDDTCAELSSNCLTHQSSDVTSGSYNIASLAKDTTPIQETNNQSKSKGDALVLGNKDWLRKRYSKTIPDQIKSGKELFNTTSAVGHNSRDDKQCPDSKNNRYSLPLFSSGELVKIPVQNSCKSETIKDKIRRNKLLYMSNTFPLWQTNHDSNAVPRVHTPTITTYQDCEPSSREGQSSPVHEHDFDSNMSSNSSLQNDPDAVQDEMLAITKELHRLSEGEKDVLLTSENKLDGYKHIGTLPVDTIDSTKELSPIYETRTTFAEDKSLDKSKFFKPNIRVLKKINLGKKLPNLWSKKYEKILKPSENHQKNFVLSENVQSIQCKSDKDGLTENIESSRIISDTHDDNAQAKTTRTQLNESFDSPSRKRVSFCLEDAELSNEEDAELSNENNLSDKDSKTMTSLKFQTDCDAVTRKMQLRKAYSLCEGKESNNGSDLQIQHPKRSKMQRTHSLPSEAQKAKEALKSPNLNDKLNLFSSLGLDQNIHDIADEDEQCNLPTDGQRNMAFVKDIPNVIPDTPELKDSTTGNSTCEEGYESDYDNSSGNVGANISSQDNSVEISPDGKEILKSGKKITILGKTGKQHRLKQLKPWFSLDSRVGESTPLATSFLKPMPNSASGAISDHNMFSFDGEDFFLDDNELSDESNGRQLDGGSHVTLDDRRNNKDEDRLSLEFFLPVRKQYIRLHRSTFIRFVLKYSIFLLTFLFWVASVTGIAFGVWMLMSNKVFIDDITDVFLDPYVLLSAVGGIIFLISFFGCVGALRENIFLLKLFHIALTVVLVLEGLLSTLVFLFYTMPEFRQAVKVGPEEVLKKAVKDYFDDDGARHWIDTVQKEFQCCGVSMSNTGYMDWQENIYFNCSMSNPSVYRCSVPLSCCIFEPGEYINYRCGANIMNSEESYILHMINTKGCMKSFGEWLGKNDAVIGYVALGVIIPQILGVVAARFFIKHLQKRSSASWRKLSDTVTITS